MISDEMKKLGRKKAQNTIDFIQSLRHVKSPWHGCFFDLLPWQDRIIKDVYGTLKPDGTRQYKFVYLEIPKKQGKSELCAALALKHLCADDEYGAEVYGCAADRSQASLVFDVAVQMVEQEPELSSRCKIIESRKRIVYLPTKSYYQVLSAEAYTKHGLNLSACIFDELHAQPNRDLYDVMTFGAGDARTQPIWWIITTAGDDPDRQSIGWEVHKKAEEILLGNKRNPIWYPVIFGVDPEEKRIWKGWSYEPIEDGMNYVKDRQVWQAVNPSLNHTVKEEKLEEALIDAEASEADERLFRQLRLNEWVKFKLSKWISLTEWDASSGMVIPEQLQGRECYGGLDLSSKVDITAFVLVFPPNKDDHKYRILPYFWIPEENMKERVRRDHVKYDEWRNAGLIKTTPGNVIDYAFIRKAINELGDQYKILEIGFDPWNATQFSLQLTDDGFKCVEVRQGYRSMSPPMVEMEGQIKARKFAHGGNPVLRWMFGNMYVKKDENNNIRPVKDKSAERIDGIVAMINAMARIVMNTDRKSIYEIRGMRSLL
jgi:phage terminase large subunit-like protein